MDVLYNYPSPGENESQHGDYSTLPSSSTSMVQHLRTSVTFCHAPVLPCVVASNLRIVVKSPPPVRCQSQSRWDLYLYAWMYVCTYHVRKICSNLSINQRPRTYRVYIYRQLSTAQLVSAPVSRLTPVKVIFRWIDGRRDTAYYTPPS